MPVTTFSRRSFLTQLSLGAATVLLSPFLRTLRAEAAGLVRKRFLLVVQGNGFSWDRITPPEVRTAGDAYGSCRGRESIPELEWFPQKITNRAGLKRLSPAMKALEAKYLNKTLIVDCLANRQNDLTCNHENGAALTCVPNRDGSGESHDVGGISFDQYLAHSPSMSNGLFKSVDLSVFQDSSNASCMAYGPGQTVPLVNSPSEALMRYFAGIAKADDPTAQLVLAKKKKLFDLMRSDIRRLETNLRGTEKEKLEAYLASIATIEQRITSSSGAQSCKAGGPTVSTGLSMEDRFDAMMAIATEALACGLTQVATVSITTGGDHWGRWDKAWGDMVNADVHTSAHCSPPYGELPLDRSWNYVAAGIAAAADRLDRVIENGASVFSNSAILWHSNNGGDHHHSTQHRWNGVIVGNAGGKLRADGRYVRYPTSYVTNWPNDDAATSRRSNYPDTHSWADLFCTLAHALDAPTDTFGKSPTGEPVTGPLREILV